MHRARERYQELSKKLLVNPSIWTVNEEPFTGLSTFRIGHDAIFRLTPDPATETNAPSEPQSADPGIRYHLQKKDGAAPEAAKDQLLDTDLEFNLELDLVLATRDMATVLEFASEVGPVNERQLDSRQQSTVQQSKYGVCGASEGMGETDSDSCESGEDEREEDDEEAGTSDPSFKGRPEIKPPVDIPMDLQLPETQRLEMEMADEAMRSLAEETTESFPLRRTFRSQWYTNPKTWRVEEPLHVVLNSPRRDAVLNSPRKGFCRTTEAGMLPLGRQKLEVCPDELDEDDIHGIMLEKQVIHTDIAKSFKAHLEASNGHVPHFLESCETPRVEPPKKPPARKPSGGGSVESTPRLPSIAKPKQSPRTMSLTPRGRSQISGSAPVPAVRPWALKLKG
eukprot:TRINITY_DN19046_c0_g1_i1.p1 TRINITY_DN19046_c0_g1~~TRINITY_DN19046_c0_g1_i1.p1  ORF type:complete len:395 (-),score=72.62 TRINITY_DN19046_c0_g1_i1:284-1468(-)